MISILLIDHALENPRSVRNLLSEYGDDFELTCANTYVEILEEFRWKTYDVCVIDSAVENGHKLFALARSLGCTAPVVLVTSSDARDALTAMRNGVADCLVRDDLTAGSIQRSIYSVVEQARSLLLQHQRERRYLALLDNANGILYTHDLEGNFTSMNRTGEQLVGYSQWEILEMNLFQIVVPEYRALVARMIERTLDAQTQTADQVQLLTRDGSHLTVEISTHPIHLLGKTIEVQGAATTIPGGWSARGPSEFRDLLTNIQSRTASGENKEGQFDFSPQVARNFLPRRNLSGLNDSTPFQ